MAEGSSRAIGFTLAATLAAIVVVALALSRAMAWWWAVPLSVVVGVGLVALSHAAQGGGRSVLEVGCSALFVAVIVGVLTPVAGRMRARAKQSGCATNLRRIGQGFALYAADAEGRLPPAAGWSERIASRVPAPHRGRTFGTGPFECAARPGVFGYAFYEPAATRRLASLEGPLAYDGATGAVDETDRTRTWPGPHPGSGAEGGNVLFADGAVGWRRTNRRLGP